MTKVKILQTTMVAGHRHAKGDEVNLDEPTAQNLIALGKAEILKEQKAAKEARPALPASGKAEHKT